MKKARKALLTLCAALLLVTMSVGATIAYLTDEASVTNTFTVGKVIITLDEAPVNTEGEVVEGNRRDNNNYKLMPGHTYTKDPTVHVDEDSEVCWVFVTVENSIVDYEADDVAGEEPTTIHAQILANGWTKLEDGVYYKSEVAGGANLIVFESFTLADDAAVVDEDGEPVDVDDIVITAYAIQADGIDTVEEAWTALNNN